MSKHVKGVALVTEPDFFSRLEPLEHRTARDYLLSQEIVRLQRIIKRDPKAHQYIQTVPVWDAARAAFCPGKLETIIRVHRPEAWLATRVAMIRKAFGLHKTFTSTPVAGSPLWFNHPATRVIVLWPEWPGKHYFEIPVEERLRRIVAFSTLNESDRLAALAYLLNPHNPATRKKVVIDIAILTSSTWQEQLEAFKATLQSLAPELFKAPPAKQGRSDETRVLDDLNAFAAYQLCRIERLPRARALKRICHPKGHQDAGKPVYRRPDDLSKPLQRFPRLLWQFQDEIMGNLTPLSPDSFGVLPDFTQLE